GCHTEVGRSSELVAHRLPCVSQLLKLAPSDDVWLNIFAPLAPEPSHSTGPRPGSRTHLFPRGEAMTRADLVGDVGKASPESPPLNRGDRNLNPEGIGFFSLLNEDLRTHGGDLFEQGFWAVAVHRFGNWRMGIRPKLLRAPFSIIYKCLYK